MRRARNSEGSRTQLGQNRTAPAGNRAEHLPAEHRPPSAGLCPATSGNFAGDHVQPSSVARAFLSPFRILKRFLQLAQDVCPNFSVRDGLCLSSLPSIPVAHADHSPWFSFGTSNFPGSENDTLVFG